MTFLRTLSAFALALLNAVFTPPESTVRRRERDNQKRALRDAQRLLRW